MTAYRARWVMPVAEPPVEQGTVEVDGGRIAAVHRRYDPQARDLGNVALVPGLVNAHTHLEFSAIAQPLGPAGSFTDWIRTVLAQRRQRTGTAADAVRQGLAESATGGTTLIGEITTDDATLTAFDETAPAVCTFREVIGLLPEQHAAQRKVARRHLAGGVGSPPRRGLSPHAPYSVHPDLFTDLVALAVESCAPLAMHLAETPAERELLRHGTGPLVALLEQLGVWRDGLIPRGTGPMDYLRRLADAERALVIHGNDLTDEELAFVAGRPSLTVVYCPRTHAYFGHGPHPWRDLLDRRPTAVCLGTDSRASNPDLSLWHELQFLRARFPAVDPALLLRLATSDGAAALGWGDETGTLEPGKSADFTVVALPDAAAGDPFELLFDPRSQVVATARAGRWLSGLSAAS